MDETGAKEIIARFEEFSSDMVIDYEHQTLSGEKAPAAGWIKALTWRGDGEGGGLWARVEWTEAAAGYIRAGEYRYFSPVFYTTKKERRIVRLHNVALTNQPRMLNVRALAAKLDMNDINERSGIMWEKLKNLLGLGESATEGDTVQAVEALKSEVDELKEADPVACREVLEALDMADGADKEKVIARITSLRRAQGAKDGLEAEIASLRESHDEMKRRMEERERDDRVAAAMKAGKITPAQKEWADGYALSDPAGFDAFVAKAPVVVPLDDLPAEGGPGGGGTPAERIERLIAKKMGEDKALSYAEAMNLVTAENPGLAEEYLAAGRGDS